jgi:hypothetical protein
MLSGMSPNPPRSDAAVVPRLAVSVNGVLRATAGLNGNGVLTAMVGHHTEDPARANLEDGRKEDAEPATWVSLGSLDSEPDEFRDWLLNEPLSPGDVVVIEVLGPGEFDPPAKVRAGSDVRGGWEQEQDDQRAGPTAS